MRRKILKPTLATLLLVLVNIYFQFRTGINNPKFGDSQHYLLSAQAIYQGQEYPRVIANWPFFRPPGYPFIISILWKITSFNSILVIKLFNSICLGFIGLAVYALARRNMSQNFAVVALILATLNPFVFLQSLEVSTETITTMLFIYSIILLTSDEFKAKGLLLGMVNIGLIAIRPEFLFISMTSIVIYYLLLNFNPNKLIIPILLVALSLNFWGFQNKKATGSYMLLTNATSFQLWLGSTETVYENYPLKFQNTTKFSKDQFHQFISDIEKVKRKYDFNGTVTDLPRQSTAWLSEYKNNVGQDKLGYLQNYLIKCLVFWRPFLNPSSYGQGMVLVSFIILFPFMVCSFIGYVLALRRRIFYREIVVLTNCLIILTIIHALQMPDFRYRVPIQIPTMSIFAVYFLNTISKSFLEKKKTY